jgi:hypothetical protein
MKPGEIFMSEQDFENIKRDAEFRKKAAQTPD